MPALVVLALAAAFFVNAFDATHALVIVLDALVGTVLLIVGAMLANGDVGSEA